MKNISRTIGIFFFALLLGVVLAPQATSMAHLTESSLSGQIQTYASQVQTSLDAAAPDVAVRVATALIVLGAVIAGIFVYLLVFVPIRIHSIQSEIRRQREEIAAMKSEVHLSSELLMDARHDYQGQNARPAERVTGRKPFGEMTLRRQSGESPEVPVRH